MNYGSFQFQLSLKPDFVLLEDQRGSMSSERYLMVLLNVIMKGSYFAIIFKIFSNKWEWKLLNIFNCFLWVTSCWYLKARSHQMGSCQKLKTCYVTHHKNWIKANRIYDLFEVLTKVLGNSNAWSTKWYSSQTSSRRFTLRLTPRFEPNFPPNSYY